MTANGLVPWVPDLVESGWVIVGVAIGLVAFTLAYLRSGPVAELRVRTGQPLPEGRPFRPYTKATLQRFLSGTDKSLAPANDETLGLYRRALQADLVFGVLFSLGLVLLVNGTVGLVLQTPEQHAWLIWIPVAVGIVDVIEDLCLLMATRKSEVSSPWTLAAVLATLTKWVAVSLSVALVLAGAIVLGYRGSGVVTP